MKIAEPLQSNRQSLFTRFRCSNYSYQSLFREECSSATSRSVEFKADPIILLQNGLGVFEEVRQLLPEQPILILSTSNGAYWHESAFLKLTGIGSSYFGTLDNSVPDSLKKILLKQLKATGLPVLFTDNILKQLWEKLMVNCSINSLSALWLCRNGDLLDNPNSKQIWKRIVQEGFR